MDMHVCKSMIKFDNYDDNDYDADDDGEDNDDNI